MALSSDKSATSFFSLPFSSSNCFSRRISSGNRPSYFFFQLKYVAWLIPASQGPEPPHDPHQSHQLVIIERLVATHHERLGFMGALIGSVSRPLGGWLSDRIGGARVTLAVFLGMAFATAFAIGGVQERSFGLFFGSYMVIFLLAGMGNGSTYKMIPSIFALLGRNELTDRDLGIRASLLFRRCDV